MKKNLLAVFMLCSMFMFSEEIIVTKNNTKRSVTFLKESFKYDNNLKKIFYKVNVNDKLQSLNYKDFDYVEFSDYRFKVFKMGNLLEGYFVLAETKTRTLLVASIDSKEEVEDEEPVSDVLMLIVNDEGAIVEKNIYDKKDTQKSIDARYEVFNLIKFHFPDCSQIIERVKFIESKYIDKNYVGILKLFTNPVYTKCE